MEYNNIDIYIYVIIALPNNDLSDKAVVFSQICEYCYAISVSNNIFLLLDYLEQRASRVAH